MVIKYYGYAVGFVVIDLGQFLFVQTFAYNSRHPVIKFETTLCSSKDIHIFLFLILDVVFRYEFL